MNSSPEHQDRDRLQQVIEARQHEDRLPDLPPRLLPELEYWVRWFGYASMAGGILLCLFIVTIPFGAFSIWQGLVLFEAEKQVKMAYERNDVRALKIGMERIGFHFIIQILGLMFGLVLTVAFALFFVFVFGVSAIGQMAQGLHV